MRTQSVVLLVSQVLDLEKKLLLPPPDGATIKNYQDLPVNCIKYLEAIEKQLGIPIKYISTGADRQAVIIKY